MTRSALINVVKALLPYALVIGVVALGHWKYNNDISTSRQEGFDAGVTHQKGVQAQVDQEEGDRRNAEKEKLERQYQAKLESMGADLAFSNSANERLQQEIDTVRQLLGENTGTQLSGTSTLTLARVLTDLYSESVREYNKVAEEAERYRIAGEQCEIQYDTIRGNNVQSTTVDHTTN